MFSVCQFLLSCCCSSLLGVLSVLSAPPSLQPSKCQNAYSTLKALSVLCERVCILALRRPCTGGFNTHPVLFTLPLQCFDICPGIWFAQSHSDCWLLCVNLRLKVLSHFLFFRLSSSGRTVDGRVRHVVRLHQRARPAGRTSDQTASFLRLEARHCGFVSLQKAELWSAQHHMSGWAPFPGELCHFTQPLQVLLEGF